MKHIGEEIHRIIEEKKLLKKDVAAQAHMSYSNLASIKYKSSIDCQLLEDLCKVIGINPAYFFDDYQSNNHIGNVNTNVGIGSATVNISQGEIEMLRKMLDEKERTIQILIKSKGFTPKTNEGQDREQNESHY